MTDLKSLLAAATQLPWTVTYETENSCEPVGRIYISNADKSQILDGCGCCDSPFGDKASDIDLMVLAVNAAPAVLEYMRKRDHAPMCIRSQNCTCGYQKLAEALGYVD